MRSVQVTQTVPSSVAEAERCWYDTSRWSSWVEGLDRVLLVEGGWPAVGGRVTWESGPAGRGRVTERVLAYAPLAGQTVEVQDDSIRGRQSVAFTAAPEGVEVTLTLEYELKRRSLVSPVVDLLFIRRAMAASLGVTVTHFAFALQSGYERGAFPDRPGSAE